jgi:hypothetical protein
MMLLTRMPLVLLLAFSSAACNVTKWSIIGDEFNLEHEICKEIPKNGALKIAVPTGFDLSNSSIIKQFPEGWTLTESGTTQIKLNTSKTTSANTLIEITLSNAKAPAHYIVPYHKKITKFSRVVSKKGGFDCAKCTAATATATATPVAAPVNCSVSNWSKLSECSVSCGDGNKTKTRTVTTQAENGGAACPALEASEGCTTCRAAPVLLQLKSQSSMLNSEWISLTSDTKDGELESMDLGGVTMVDGMMTKLLSFEKAVEGVSFGAPNCSH